MDENNNKKSLKEFVEDKIRPITFYAKNFSKEEIIRVDEYCKLHFGNDRKKMILTLITLVENNVLYDALNDKLDLMFINLSEEIDNIKKELNTEQTIKEKTKPKKVSWKGFSNDSTK